MQKRVKDAFAVFVRACHSWPTSLCGLCLGLCLVLTAQRVVRAPQDTDNSGTIDAGEMRKIMYNLGEKMSLEQVDGMLRQFDENGDGQVDAQEFAKALLEEKRMGSAAVSSKSPRVDDAVRPF